MENAICYAFGYIIEALTLSIYTSRLFERRRPGKNFAANLLPLSALYLTLFFISLFQIPSVNLTCFVVFHFLYFLTQYQLKGLMALFHSILLMILMWLSELMLLSFFPQFVPAFYEGAHYFWHSLTLVALTKIIYCTIIFILLHILKGKKKYFQDYNKITFLLVLIPLLSLWVSITLAYLPINTPLSSGQIVQIAISCVFLLIINLLVFGIQEYSQRKNAELTEMQILLQKESDFAEYYKMLLQETENHNILLHDIKKHLQSIYLLSKQGKQEEISAYIDRLLSSSDLKESARMCDNDLLNAILCRYQKHCRQNKLSFHTDIRCGVIDFLDSTDMTSLFCNLLDNAVEAASKIPAGYVEISVSCRPNTAFVVISLLNSCHANPLDKKGHLLTGNHIPSTKPDAKKHGFGMKSIQKVVDKYSGSMTCYYEEVPSVFHTVIALKPPG